MSRALVRVDRWVDRLVLVLVLVLVRVDLDRLARVDRLGRVDRLDKLDRLVDNVQEFSEHRKI